MVAIYGLFLYTLGLLAIGLVVLACFPRLRLTFLNLCLFVVGGFLGMAATGYFISPIFTLVGTSRILGLLTLPTVVAGAVGGGMGLVWLKTHLADLSKRKKTLRKDRVPQRHMH